MSGTPCALVTFCSALRPIGAMSWVVWLRNRRFSLLAATYLLLLLFSFPPLSGAQRGAMTLAYQLTHVDTGEPFPSPDGKRIVFEIKIEGVYQLFIMNTDGSGQVQITEDAANHDTPAWSPDGKRIAYASDRGGHSAIYILNVADVLDVATGHRLDGTPVSAEGSTDQRPVATKIISTLGKKISDDRHECIHPSWSPDSARVVFCSDDDLKPPAKNASEIFSVDLGTRDVATLISGGTNTYPSWSPDGKKILFRRMLGEMNSEVFVANSDGSDVQNLSHHPAFDGWPAWSQDGTMIAFASNRNANYQIWLMKADGSEPRLLANTEGRATEPRWAPDDRTVYFTNCKKADFGVDCQIMAAMVGERVPKSQ